MWKNCAGSRHLASHLEYQSQCSEADSTLQAGLTLNNVSTLDEILSSPKRQLFRMQMPRRPSISLRWESTEAGMSLRVRFTLLWVSPLGLETTVLLRCVSPAAFSQSLITVA